MKKILGVLMMLLSLQLYAGTVNMDMQTDDVIDVELNKGKSDNTDRHPRTLNSYFMRICRRNGTTVLTW